MTQLGKTIRLFLVDGSPLGLITAEIMNWTGKILSFPRGLLPEALKRPEVAKTGIYFLVGPDPDNPFRPLVYIGESDDVAKRLRQHDADESKDFFEQVALIVSKDENLTKSHVRYLESRLIDTIRSIGAATLKNGNQGSPVLLPEAERSDMEYVLQQLQVLMPVLSYTFLQEIPTRGGQKTSETEKNDTPKVESPLFELIAENGLLHAEAYEQEGRFVILPGAHIRWEPELQETTGCYDFREAKAFLYGDSHLTKVEQSIYRLEVEYAFKSPSAASCFVRHRRQYNGRTDWKIKGTGKAYGDWRKAQVEAVNSETNNLLEELLTSV